MLKKITSVTIFLCKIFTKERGVSLMIDKILRDQKLLQLLKQGFRNGDAVKKANSSIFKRYQQEYVCEVASKKFREDNALDFLNDNPRLLIDCLKKQYCYLNMSLDMLNRHSDKEKYRVKTDAIMIDLINLLIGIALKFKELPKKIFKQIKEYKSAPCSTVFLLILLMSRIIRNKIGYVFVLDG